jgi:hypothetical protein
MSFFAENQYGARSREENLQVAKQIYIGMK